MIRMPMKRFGAIDPWENPQSEDLWINRVFPAFFLGYEIKAIAVGILSHYLAAHDNEKLLETGQYVIEHEYAGRDRSHTTLFGTFFPISTAKDSKLNGRVTDAVLKTRGLYLGSVTEGEDLGRWAGTLAALGPIEVTSSPARAQAAYVQFEPTDAVVGWVTSAFKQLVGFGEDCVMSDVAWKSSKDLTDWLAPERRLKVSGRFLGALLYDNRAARKNTRD